MEEDFLSSANPELVECYEEYERSFCMERTTSALDSDNEHSDTDSEGCPTVTEVRTEDVDEDQTTEQFFRETCYCTLGKNNNPCSMELCRKHAVEYRQQCFELSKDELDMAVLGELAALRRREPTISIVSDFDRQKKRRITPRPYTAFRFGDMPICKNSFLFLHGMTLKRFKNLCRHFDSSGLVPRTHGNTKRVPHNALPLETTQRVLDFICNYAETHALPLPGRLPSHRDFQVMLIPTDTTKSKLYFEFQKACEPFSLQCCSKSHFMYLWRKQLPYICIMKPLH